MNEMRFIYDFSSLILSQENHTFERIKKGKEILRKMSETSGLEESDFAIELVEPES